MTDGANLTYTEMTFENLAGQRWNNPFNSSQSRLMDLVRSDGLRMVAKSGNGTIIVLFYNAHFGPEFLDVIFTITGEETALQALREELDRHTTVAN